MMRHDLLSDNRANRRLKRYQLPAPPLRGSLLVLMNPPPGLAAHMTAHGSIVIVSVLGC